MQVIYILHFDTPIAHASHYVGSTANLFRRLKQHACGHGSRIMEVCLERAIEWTVGGLLIVETEARFEKEKYLKRQHNAERFCQICTPTTHRLKGTLPMDISLLDFKSDSISLRDRKY